MKHTEYIVPIGEEATDYDEMFIGVIRRQPELIRCKDCRFYQRKYCTAWGDETVAVACETDADGYCYLAERKEE